MGRCLSGRAGEDCGVKPGSGRAAARSASRSRGDSVRRPDRACTGTSPGPRIRAGRIRSRRPAAAGMSPTPKLATSPSVMESSSRIAVTGSRVCLTLLSIECDQRRSAAGVSTARSRSSSFRNGSSRDCGSSTIPSQAPPAIGREKRAAAAGMSRRPSACASARVTSRSKASDRRAAGAKPSSSARPSPRANSSTSAVSIGVRGRGALRVGIVVDAGRHALAEDRGDDQVVDSLVERDQHAPLGLLAGVDGRGQPGAVADRLKQRRRLGRLDRRRGRATG